MANKSLPQLNSVFSINDSDKFHIRRNSIDKNLTGVEIKYSIKPYYEMVGLLSQNAPITVTGGTLYKGATYSIISYIPGDNFSNMQLLSGSFTTSGSTFKAISTTPISYTSGSTIVYSGAPYFSSIDINGLPNPFENTFNIPITFDYITVGAYKINVIYDPTKISIKIGSYNDKGPVYDPGEQLPIFSKIPNFSGISFYYYNSYYVGGATPHTFADGLLNNSPFKLIAYY